MLELTGTIQYITMGTGTWALVSEDGMTYELYESPSEMRQEGMAVKVMGRVRDDVMTMAMIGPVLEVMSFEAIE